MTEMSLPADDLLSALHDGELSSAERAAVEQRLAASAEVRREFSEIQQVSSLLKALPRERLPSEFPQQVLQAIEREMLIPSRPDHSTNPLPLTGRHSNSSRRWAGVAAVLTSAAGLLLLVRALDDRTGQESSSVRRLAGSSNLRSEVAETIDEPPASGGIATSMRMADARPLTARKSGVAGGFGSGSLGASNTATDDSPSFAGAAARETNSLFFDQSTLRGAKIGDVVGAMQTEGSEVAVVWLTVVDRQEGLTGLQVLLTKNRIPAADTDPKADASKPADSFAKAESDSHQMHAVFVESDAEQLAETLKQLRESSFLQSLEVDQPIELAELELKDVRGGQTQLAERLRHGLFESQRLAKNIDAAEQRGASIVARGLKLPSASVAEKNIASEAPIAPAKSALAERLKLQDSKDQLAKQVTFEFPLDALVQNQMSQLSRHREASRNQFRLPVPSDKNVEKAAADQRPMQVLFVVVDQAQAGKAVVPTNTPKAKLPAKDRSPAPKPAGQDGAA